jgi:hypothetical protein
VRLARQLRMCSRLTRPKRPEPVTSTIIMTPATVSGPRGFGRLGHMIAFIPACCYRVKIRVFQL